MPIKAYAAKGPKQRLEPFEYEPGPLGPDEVEVRVSHCGICHSDLAMIDNDWGFSRYPLVPGHEAIGVVSAVGAKVDALAVGTRVGVGWHAGSCGRCEWCRRGKESLCAQEKGVVVGRHGAWADSVRVDWRFAVPMPDAIDSEVAGPLMCAGSTVFTPMVEFGVKPWMRTAVVGIGGLGHLAVQFLAAFGCEVTAISSSHAKDDQARALGATRFIASKSSDELQKAAGSFDFIMSTVDADLAWADFVRALRPQGRLVFVGIPSSDVSLSVFDLIQEKSVSGGSSGGPCDTARMLDFVARNKVRTVTEQFAMKDVNQALDHVRAGKARFRVVLANS
jgi:alcohol/geraniol dehydrogenase (NADP+)